jgi:hypothetical protein
MNVLLYLNMPINDWNIVNLGNRKALVGNARYIAINRFFERKCVRSCDLLVLE